MTQSILMNIDVSSDTDVTLISLLVLYLHHSESSPLSLLFSPIRDEERLLSHPFLTGDQNNSTREGKR